MADKFTDDQVQAFKANFALFDKNGDGKVTHEEVGVVMRSLGVKTTEQDLKDMIKEIDLDGNGTVDFPEFLAMMGKRYENSEDSPEKDLKDAFKVFDRQGTGFVSSQDLRNAMIVLGESLTEQEADKMIREADSNSDGFIDYNDFVERLCKPR